MRVGVYGPGLRFAPSGLRLLRFARATGHRLKISFQPMKGKG